MREITFKKTSKMVYAKYRLITNKLHEDFGKYKFVGNVLRKDFIKMVKEGTIK